MVASDVPTQDLERASELTNLANDIVLFIFDEDVLVARVRNVRVNIKFVVAYVRLEDVPKVTAFIILFECFGI